MDRYQEMQALRQNWKPPVELAGSVPREVQLKPGGYALAAVSVLLILGGIAGAVLLQAKSDRDAAREALLAREGSDTEARVTRVWHSDDKEHQPMISYRFEVEGRVYRKSVKTPSSIWNTLAAGSPLAVRFLPADPAITHPRDWPEDRMPSWVPFLIGLALSGIGVFLGFLMKRQMRLLAEGGPAPAVVTRHSRSQHGQKHVHYEFAPPHGAPVKGKSDPVRKPPDVGATICVVYDRDNPKRSAIYPFSMVRVVR